MRGPVLRGALLWLVAVVAAAATGTAAVRLATSSVTDPVAPVALTPVPSPSATVDATPDPAPTPDGATPAPTATPDDDGSVAPDDDPTATPGPTSTGTPDDDATPDASPTPDDDPSPDDATPAAETTRTASSVGGQARFRFVDGRVELIYANPVGEGWTVDVEDEGDSVRVRFRSDDHESRIRADYDGGEPTVVVEEDAED